MAVTAPAGWSPEALEKLKLTLTERMRASSGNSGDTSYENRGGSRAYTDCHITL
jgi:hypothetical protein